MALERRGCRSTPGPLQGGHSRPIKPQASDRALLRCPSVLGASHGAASAWPGPACQGEISPLGLLALGIGWPDRGRTGNSCWRTMRGIRFLG